MADPTTDLNEVLQRVVDLCAMIDGIKSADIELPEDINPSITPFIFVDEGPARYQLASANVMDVERDYLILLFGAQYGKTEKGFYGTEAEARKAVRPYQTIIPKFFARARRLELDGAGLNGVKYAFCRADDGLSSGSRKDRLLSGVLFILTVGYSEFY